MKSMALTENSKTPVAIHRITIHVINLQVMCKNGEFYEQQNRTAN